MAKISFLRISGTLKKAATFIPVWFVAVISLLSWNTAYAQDEITIDDLVPDLTPEQQADAGTAFGIYTSASSIFTGLNSASSGYFTFDTGEDRNDSELNIVRIPIEYPFGEKGDTFRPIARGVLGRFKGTASIYDFYDALKAIEGELPPELLEFELEPDFRVDEANTLSLGAGLAINPIEHFTITPSFDLIWTHIKRRFDSHNLVSALLETKFDRVLFDTSVEAISYTPSVKVEYEIPVADALEITPSLEYAHLFTEDLWSKSALANFSTDAGVLRSTIEAKISTSHTLFNSPLGLHPYVIRTDLYQAAKESVGLNQFYDFGLDFTFGVELGPIRELLIGAAYLYGDDLDGYRIGIGAEM